MLTDRTQSAAAMRPSSQRPIPLRGRSDLVCLADGV